VGLLKALFLGLAAFYALAIAGLGLFQRKLIYFPDSRLVSPSQAGLDGVEELRIATADGESLVAWHAPPRDGRPLILYFHGNGGGLVDRAPRFRSLLASGYGLLAVAFRGYCGSTGSPTEDGLLQDGKAAYEAARAKGYKEGRIVVIGESLGTGVAVPVAAEHDVAALILDSPYSSAVDIAAEHYPLFPARWLMRDQFRSDKAIGRVRAPILMVHGDRDRIIPLRFARRLFEKANEPKSLLVESGSGHLVLGSPDVFPRVRAWIDERTVFAAR
jgi:fermentation-respiration switch protein FrsA (DUF1100 family)